MMTQIGATRNLGRIIDHIPKPLRAKIAIRILSVMTEANWVRPKTFMGTSKNPISIRLALYGL
jgi:hypothetical protein